MMVDCIYNYLSKYLGLSIDHDFCWHSICGTMFCQSRLGSRKFLILSRKWDRDREFYVLSLNVRTRIRMDFSQFHSWNRDRPYFVPVFTNVPGNFHWSWKWNQECYLNICEFIFLNCKRMYVNETKLTNADNNSFETAVLIWIPDLLSFLQHFSNFLKIFFVASFLFLRLSIG